VIEVEVLEGEAETLLLKARFGALPRVGEYLTIDTDGIFKYWNVLEVWHRQDGTGQAFVPCIRVELDD
jgi:Uma2 family endonuclease